MKLVDGLLHDTERVGVVKEDHILLIKEYEFFSLCFHEAEPEVMMKRAAGMLQKKCF